MKKRIRYETSLTPQQCWEIQSAFSFGFLPHLLLSQLLLGNTDCCAKYELLKIVHFNKILTRGKHAK